jgi:mono/diheme cytochrome c family protein
MKKTLTALAAALLLSACTDDNPSTRWYSAAQVERGQTVFANNCATCHGPQAAATPDWKTPMDNGKYPAPPLNGSAHAWHHSLSVLRRTVAQGGVPLGGWMPGFQSRLRAEDRDAAIAYFQSLWSDEIYAAWLQRGGVDG